MRFFNTEGPVRPDRHYSLPPLRRWNLEAVMALIDQEKYFLLHAPRQTGKTSCLLALMDHLNREGLWRDGEPGPANGRTGAIGRLSGRAGPGHGLAGDFRPPERPAADPRTHGQHRTDRSPRAADHRDSGLRGRRKTSYRRRCETALQVTWKWRRTSRRTTNSNGQHTMPPSAGARYQPSRGG